MNRRYENGARRRLSPIRWLLRLALPADERDAIVAELDEAQAVKFPAGGFRSWAWYWRQAFSFSVCFIAERYHESSRHKAIDRARKNHASPSEAALSEAPSSDARRRVATRDTATSHPGPQLAPPDLRNREDTNMRGFIRDIGFAIRQLFNQPAFTAVVVLTLALGIGPNTAIFSVVNGVLLQPLPYEDPHELSLMRIDLSGLVAHPGLAEAEVVDFRQRAELLADVGAVTREYTASLTAEGNMEAVLAADVSPNLFPLLGISPQIGRYFTEEEGQFGVDDEGQRQFPSPVAILGYGLWQRRYGGDPEVINQTIEINNNEVPIAGVMPEGFQLLLGPGTSLSPNVDLWHPLVLDPQDRGFWAYRTIARLAPDATFEQAGVEIAAIGAQLVEENPDAYEGSDIKFYLHPLHSDLVQNVRPAILALLGAVSLVLLIACTNAASLLLARTKSREKEIAVRAALGAGRGRLMSQVLTESVVLAFLAGVVGLVLGALGLDLFLSMQPGNLPRVDDIGLDRTVLAFTFGASFVAALLFGVVPAWQASKPQLHDVLKGGRRVGGSGIRSRTRAAFVVAQVAFSVTLLIGAGLLIRTFGSLSQVDLGFDPESVITMQAPLDGNRYGPDERWALYRQLREQVEAIPGVSAAGSISILPLSNQNMMASFGALGSLDADSNWNGTSADYRFVTPGYFEAMGTGILAGRGFEDHDNEGILPVGIVDETLARAVWPEESPIGKRLEIGLGSQLNRDDTDGEDVLGNNAVEIIGVVQHTRGIDVRREVRPQIYLPYRLGPSSNNILAVRAAGDPGPIVAQIRREVEELGTGRPVHTVRTMDAYVAEAMGETRFTLILMGALASIALLLSTVGIYSVISFLVRTQAHETGIRMALGAHPSDIVRMTVRKGLLLAAIGLPIGLVGAAFLTRFIQGLLYGVSATDPVTYVGIPLLLVLVTLAASYIPARRASRVDPLLALRNG